MRIKIKDIYDGVGGFGQGTTIVFEVRDESDEAVSGKTLETVRRESWFTQNSGGVDYYFHEGPKQHDVWPAQEILDDDGYELLEAFFEEVGREYQEAWKEFVNPAIGRAVDKAIAASEAMADEDKFQGVTVDML